MLEKLRKTSITNVQLDSTTGTFLRVFQPVLRKQAFEVWRVLRSAVRHWSQLEDYIGYSSKPEVLFEFYDSWNLVALPTAR